MSNNAKLYGDIVWQYCPELKSTFMKWKADPFYDFGRLLSLHLDQLSLRVSAAIFVLEDVTC
jgi:hypothetical protein